MTDLEKQYLRRLCKQGLTFDEIYGLVNCSDATIRQYMRVFGPPTGDTFNE